MCKLTLSDNSLLSSQAEGDGVDLNDGTKTFATMVLTDTFKHLHPYIKFLLMFYIFQWSTLKLAICSSM